MPLKDIVGQETARRSLEGFLAAGKVPHALLFTGPNGCGKRTAAYALAQAANCAAPTGGDACGACASCRRIANRQDIDTLFFEPARLGIPKETAEEIRLEASITPNSARKKFIIVDRVDTMNPTAANLLLKTFEEPPESTVFVLLTANEHLILPTIRSRTITVGFRPLEADEAVRAAAGRTDEKIIRFLHPLAKGDVGFMLRLAEDENMKSVFADLEKLLEKRLDGNSGVSPSVIAGEFISIAGRIDMSSEDDTESTSQRKSVVFALEALLVFLDRRFSEIVGAGAGTSGGGGAIITDRHRSLCRRMETAIGTIRAIEGGGHVQLMLETMALDFIRGAAAAT